MQNAFELQLECTLEEAKEKLNNPFNTELCSYLGDVINDFTYEGPDGYTVTQMTYDCGFGNNYFFTTILFISNNEKCDIKVFSISPNHIFTNPHKKLENLLNENLTGIKPENIKPEFKSENKDSLIGLYLKDKSISEILDKKKRDRDFKKRGL